MRFALFLMVLFSFTQTHASWLVKKVIKGNQEEVVAVEASSKKLSKEFVVLKSLPHSLAEELDTSSHGVYEEVLYRDDALPQQYLIYHTQPLEMKQLTGLWTQSEVRTLVNQGDPENRIDLTIVGDGYTLQERERFFADAQRIADDLFGESTFVSYLPLFNVHAVFVPSRESGLSDVERKDTVLGLYRSPKGSKRGILPGNTTNIEKALRLAPDADYPILMANDNYYGGLGGRYAITTRSLNSGSMVLRHELGHNFGNVGEEYDGGQVYSGANSSRNPEADWGHWLDETETYESQFLSGDYVWQKLKNKNYSASFKFPNGDYDLDIRVSSVGWSDENDVHVYLDGIRQLLNGIYTDDRSFFTIQNDGLSSGSHTIEARDNSKDGDNVLAFIQVVAQPREMVRDKHHVAGYATFNSWGMKAGYRPTYDTCLMRNMRSMEFCSVDQENMWVRFLSRVDLIDSITNISSAGKDILTVDTPALEGLTIKWFQKRMGRWLEITDSKNKTGINVNPGNTYKVTVEFNTSEVRKYSSDFKSERVVEI